MQDTKNVVFSINWLKNVSLETDKITDKTQINIRGLRQG